MKYIILIFSFFLVGCPNVKTKDFKTEVCNSYKKSYDCFLVADPVSGGSSCAKLMGETIQKYKSELLKLYTPEKIQQLDKDTDVCVSKVTSVEQRKECTLLYLQKFINLMEC